MNTGIRNSLLVVIAMLVSVSSTQIFGGLQAQEKNDGQVVFNGKDFSGWTFKSGKDEKIQKRDEVWGVRDGMLFSRGNANSELKTEAQFENYELSLEWRHMKPVRNGMSASGSGRVFIHRVDGKTGAFGEPPAVEISLRLIGTVFNRGIDSARDDNWAFRAPRYANDVEKDMGEWNTLKLICRDKNLTVIVNGVAVNHVPTLHRSKGSIVLRSGRGLIAAPTFYRNIRVSKLTEKHRAQEKAAVNKIAAYLDAEKKKRYAEEQAQMAAEKKAEEAASQFEKEWMENSIQPTIEFKADACQLPFPKDMQELEFSSAFGKVELSSPSSLKTLADFYKTEMAKRGWKVTDAEKEEDSIEVSFRNGKAKVDLELEQRSKKVEISFRCKGLSFKNTKDPTTLAELGIPQPEAYLFLQKSFKLPNSAKGIEYRSGKELLFKSEEKLETSFDDMGDQLRRLGFVESRKPLVSASRRYTEYRKGSIQVNVNMFKTGKGSRAILTYNKK